VRILLFLNVLDRGYLTEPKDPPDEPNESPLTSGFHVEPAVAIIPRALSMVLQRTMGLFRNRFSARESWGRQTMRTIVASAALFVFDPTC
jgi:hypothetical protein